MNTIQCLRCGKEGPKIQETKPYPGKLGEMIADHVCQTCWEGWRKFSVNVINDYKLRPFLPDDRAVLERHMKQYLNLELQPMAGSTITLTGQGKEAAFETAPTSPLKEKVIAMLEQIYDPEIPVKVYDLGLIYDIAITGEKVAIKMTLTTPHCPAAQSLPAMVQESVKRVSGVSEVSVDIVWDPPWTKDKISAEGRQILGMD